MISMVRLYTRMCCTNVNKHLVAKIRNIVKSKWWSIMYIEGNFGFLSSCTS